MNTFYVVTYIIRQYMMVKRSTIFEYRSNISKIETNDITSRNFGAFKLFEKEHPLISLFEYVRNMTVPL